MPFTPLTANYYFKQSPARYLVAPLDWYTISPCKHDSKFLRGDIYNMMLYPDLLTILSNMHPESWGKASFYYSICVCVCVCVCIKESIT